MNYKYYLGPSGSGKTKKIMSDITKRALSESDRTFLLIVPDQYTMQAQKDMVEMNPCHGIMNIDVLSFGRLYHKVIEEVGHGSEITLDDTGKNLLLRRVSLEMADELETIGSSLDKPGFIHEVKSVISEFIQYGYDPDSIDKLIEEADKGHKKALKKKLIDLKKVYAAFQDYKRDKYITTEETMGLLARKLEQAESLNNVVIAFDGFTGFTPIQKQVIVALTHKASEMWFSIVLDSDSKQNENSLGELFGLSKRYMSSIDRIMQQEKAIKQDDSILPEGANNPRFRSAELAFVERNIFRNNNAVYEDGKVQDISIFVSDNPREELRHVCVEINRLIRTGKYAFRDMAIVTGGLEAYAPFVSDLFGSYEIPVFMDQGRKLVLNPMIEYVKAGLAVIKKNFSYESVMHLLRSGVSGIDSARIDEFENYLIALGIKGYKNYNQDFARFPKYLRSFDGQKVVITDEAVAKLGDINETRRQLMDVMAPLTKTFCDKKNQMTARVMTEALYHYIADNGLYEKIESYVDMFEAEGDLQRKKEYEQVYRELMKLLEQIVALVGDEQFELDEYIKILEAGISEIKIGIVPGQTDYVLVGDIERSRLKEIKILFLVGVNDGNIPKNSGNGGIISDLDREYLSGENSDSEIELAPTLREKMFTQKLYLYMNMTKPSEKLYLSYADTDALGKALKPSYLIDVIKKLIPGIDFQRISGRDYLSEISGKKDVDFILAELIRGYAAGSVGELEEKLFFTLYDTVKDEEKARNMRSAAFYHYETKPLAREVVSALYGKVITNSISRLERFAGCAYSHFLQYGLSLSEREEFDVSRMDIGNIYHEILQLFAKYINDHGLDWGKLSDDDARKILDEIYDGVVNSYGESIFYKDAKSAYEIERMKRVLIRAVDTVVFQVKKTAFRPKHFEFEFRNAVDAASFNIGLSEDEKLAIRGKIDRIDTYEDANNIYVKIVDYKSSQRKLDLVQVYNGLSLQLVVYLDQAVKEVQKKSSKEVKPAAMYYYPVYLPTVESTEPLNKDEINASIRKSLIQAGVSVRDDDLIEKLGGQFDKNSEVIKVDKTVKGDYSKASELIDEADLNTVISYANYKLGQISKSIIEGNIEARPCGEGACTYCPFKSVCGYDVRVDGYRDNGYEKIDKDHVIESMREKMSRVNQENGDISE